MQAEQPQLGDQAFGKDAATLVTVPYQSHRDALTFIQTVLRSPRGVGVLHGPRASGKTTIARLVQERLPEQVAVARIDGTDARPRGLLVEMLAQFGYNTDLESPGELLQMVTVFAMQQTRSMQPPILIIDNVEHMYPSALRTLDALAELKVKHRFALRILVTGDEGLSALIASENLQNIAQRHFGIFSIGPLSERETQQYLYARLTACGLQQPDSVFTVSTCERLHELSGGWPGLINYYAQEALRPERPRLIVTRDGETVSRYTSNTKKILIGRSEFADLVLDDEYASAMHAVLLLYSNALVMLDLNSSNGTTVNSVRLKSTILKENDIISIGHHRLKVENAPAMSADIAQRVNLPDTIRTKSLTEMRRLQDDLRVVAAAEKQRG
ncbi:MAG: FHA domain-containing protein [Gammaproteobacteria bacterium]|nr:FHA domain-containing protein [Gammaproteobacteria bacterium]